LLWIFDAVRQFGAAGGCRGIRLAARYRDRNVVAVGIGGDEQKGPPKLFRDAIATLPRMGFLRLTANRGRDWRAGIDLARFNLQAELLDTRTTPRRTEFSRELSGPADSGGNMSYQQPCARGCCPSIAKHPVRDYFDHGLRSR